LGDKLSIATRQLVADNLDRRIFTPFRDMVEGRRKAIFWLGATHNWNAVCLGGVTGAALATIEPAADRAFFVAAAQKYIRNFLAGFSADGYCSEGLGYWNYGFGYFVMLAETVRQATSGQVDFLADPAARAPAFFALREEIRDGVYPSVSDCDPATKPDSNLMGLLCRRFGMESDACRQTPALKPLRPLYAAGLYLFPPRIGTRCLSRRRRRVRRYAPGSRTAGCSSRVRRGTVSSSQSRSRAGTTPNTITITMSARSWWCRAGP